MKPTKFLPVTLAIAISSSVGALLLTSPAHADQSVDCQRLRPWVKASYHKGDMVYFKTTSPGTTGGYVCKSWCINGPTYTSEWEFVGRCASGIAPH